MTQLLGVYQQIGPSMRHERRLNSTNISSIHSTSSTSRPEPNNNETGKCNCESAEVWASTIGFGTC